MSIIHGDNNRYLVNYLAQSVPEVVDVIARQRIDAVFQIAFGRALARAREVTLERTSARILHADCIAVIRPRYKSVRELWIRYEII
jgi:hypothetical protein